MEPNSFFDWVIVLLQQYGAQFWQGAVVSILLALVGTFIGCIIGVLVGVLRTIPVRPKSNLAVKALHKIGQFFLAAYIEIFRGTPMIVQASVVYYGFMYAGVDMAAMMAGLLVVSINTGAYMAETVRGGIESIDQGQTEAAQAIGMTHWQTMSSVMMPQTLRNVMPQIGNNLIINIKDTSVLSVISVTELYFTGTSAAGAYFRYFEAYFIVSVIYFIMTFTCSRILRWVEHKMDGNSNYRLVSGDPMADPHMHHIAGKGKKGGKTAWSRFVCNK